MSDNLVSISRMLAEEFEDSVRNEIFFDYGRLKGRDEQLNEAVKKMWEIKLPIEKIVKITGWSEEKILDFIEKNGVSP